MSRASRLNRVAAVRGLIGLSVLGLSLAGVANAAPCEAWPGEPDPLPTLHDADVVRSSWAELRVQDLASAARKLDPGAPALAQQMWRRVLCFDPGNAEAQRGVQWASAVHVVRPEVIVVRTRIASEIDEPWRGLADPLPIYVPAPSQPPRAGIAEADALIRETRLRLQGARFDEALASAEAARLELARVDAPARAAREAQLEVLVATAALALGREDLARESLERALRADPDLQLDPAHTSPKVSRALAAVRAAQASSGEHP